MYEWSYSKNERGKVVLKYVTVVSYRNRKVTDFCKYKSVDNTY